MPLRYVLGYFRTFTVIAIYGHAYFSSLQSLAHGEQVRLKKMSSGEITRVLCLHSPTTCSGGSWIYNRINNPEKSRKNNWHSREQSSDGINWGKPQPRVFCYVSLDHSWLICMGGLFLGGLPNLWTGSWIIKTWIYTMIGHDGQK